MSEEVESEVMGHWHHPKIGKGKDGRAIFLPNMEYTLLMRDSNFKVWIDHYRGQSSKSIAKITIHRMMKAGDLASPTEFLELQVHEAKKLVRIVCNGLVSKEHAQAARQTMSFAKNFYNYHNEDLGKSLRFKRSEKPVVISKKIAIETIPHNSDIYRLTDVAQGLKYKNNMRNRLIGLRNKAILMFLWQSGIRVNALCKLKYKHIQPYIEDKVTFQFLKEEFKECNLEYWENLGLKVKELPPLFLKVTPSLDSKIGSYGLSYYVTFINHSGFQALKEWLQIRVEATQQTLKPGDPVFVVYDFSQDKLSNKSMNSHLVNHMLKTVAGRAGMNGQRIWVHVLRKSFRKVLRACPTMDDETREALMGHKLRGSQGNYFDYHDIIWTGKKYMECDWTRGNASRLNGLARQVDQQQVTIQKLQEELERYKMKETKISVKEDALTKLLDRVDKLEKKLEDKQ